MENRAVVEEAGIFRNAQRGAAGVTRSVCSDFQQSYLLKGAARLLPIEFNQLPPGGTYLVLVLVNNCVGDVKTVEVEIKKGRVTKTIFNLLD